MLSLTYGQGIYPTLVIVFVCLQGVAYHPGILTGQQPVLDMQNGHIHTDLEFAARAGTRATMRRSATISIGLPRPSIDVYTEEWHDHQREADKKSVASMPW